MEAGTPEPSAWTVTAQDASASLQGAGYTGLSPSLTSTSTVAPIVVGYDNLRLAAASTAP